ncbi:MAG: phage portal protein [Lachnospiraceae bacterium]|nr:phage portal protein [Lachnospiraceae bacterium]
MSKKRRKPNKTREKTSQTKYIGFLQSDAFDDLCASGYTRLDECPEILTACREIATLISSMTIYLMANTEKGDKRVKNELSRKIDIDPFRFMTRRSWMEFIVMTMLLHGKGNSIVLPHMEKGENGQWLLGDLEPIPYDRVSFIQDGYGYKVMIDGVEYDPQEVMHFVENPDKRYPWWGRGTTIVLKEVADNLKQAAATEKGFLQSKWKPSVIVRVDSMIEEFSTKEGRKTILEDYVESNEAGEPWMIPAEQFQVEQVKPLSLQDLAIKDTVELDRRLVASILGVPPFIVGIGEYNRDAWNSFIQNKVASVTKNIEQEMTRKLILSPKMYLKFNIFSLMDWDIKTISDVFGGLSDRGLVTGNEVRDKLHMSPMDDLDELRILENYIPADKVGDQKKLVQGE